MFSLILKQYPQSLVPFAEDDAVVRTVQAGDGHVGELKFLQFPHVCGTTGGKKKFVSRMGEQMKCMSVFRFKDIQTLKQ